jgi:VanZ family protein
VIKKFSILWGPVVLWAAFIFTLSSIPNLEVTHEPVGNFLTRKVAHLVEYATFYLLLFRAQGNLGAGRAVALTILYGVTDEVHQAFVPSRTPNVTDVLFDAMGAVLGLILWRYLLSHLLKPKP